MKVITMVVWRRPEFFSQVLKSLEEAEGIEDYTLLIHQEPGNLETLELIANIKFCAVNHVYNRTRLGMRLNTFQALRHGFSVSDYVIHLEEDVRVAPDALKYFEWCRDKYRNEEQIFTVTGYNGPQIDIEFDVEPHGPYYEEHEHYKVESIPWFTPSGWATWKDRWVEIRNAWNHGYCNVTWGMYLNLIIRGERMQAYPVLARCQNIGYYGENLGKGKSLSKEWFYENVYNEDWAGNTILTEGEFYD